MHRRIYIETLYFVWRDVTPAEMTEDSASISLADRSTKLDEIHETLIR